MAHEIEASRMVTLYSLLN